MYATLLQVAHDITVIGGALMIILGFMLLLVFLIMAIRLNNMIAKASHVVSLVSQYVLLPFSYLTTLFARSEEKKAARKTKKSNSGEK